MNKKPFLALIILSFAVVSCATTSSLDKLEKSTPQVAQLPINYIDAYANAKNFYLRCATRSSTSYPVTVYSNGTPITVTQHTPSVEVSSKLSRQTRSAHLNIVEGGNIAEHAKFSAIDENTTQVSLYTKQQGYLRSQAYKEKVQIAKFELLKKVSLNGGIECIKE